MQETKHSVTGLQERQNNVAGIATYYGRGSVCPRCSGVEGRHSWECYQGHFTDDEVKFYTQAMMPKH